MGKYHTLPLLPQVVMDIVFALLDFTSLTQCRLVCHEWNKEANHHFKNKAICRCLDWYNESESEPSRTRVVEEPPQRDKNDDDDIHDDDDESEFDVSVPSNKGENEVKVEVEVETDVKLDIEMNMTVVNLCIQETNPRKGNNQQLNGMPLDIQRKAYLLRLSPVVYNWLMKNGRNLKTIRYLLSEISENSRYNTFFKIVTEICPNLEEIQIRLTNIRSRPDIDEEYDLLKLPAVKTIIIDDSMLMDSISILDLRRWEYPFFSKLFAMAENVESLRVIANNCIHSTVFSRAIISNCGRKLKHLRWESEHDAINEVDLVLLLNLRTPIMLQTLELNCPLLALETIPSLISQLLRRHSSSLKTVMILGRVVERWDDGREDDGSGVQIRQQIGAMFNELNIINPNPNVPMNRRRQLPFHSLELPHLRMLKSLEIHDMFHLRPNSNMCSFLSDVPNLKRLTLKNVTYASNVHPLTPDQLFAWFFTDPRSYGGRFWPHNSVEEFYLVGELIEEELVKFIVKGLPNLKKIALQVSSDVVFRTLLQELSKVRLRSLDLTIRDITHMSWCNDAMIICLPWMEDLKNLRLNFVGSFNPFKLSKRTMVSGFCCAASLRWLELTGFSFCSSEMDSIMQLLRNHCISVVLKSCILHIPCFNASYDSWTSKPVPSVTVSQPNSSFIKFHQANYD